MRSLAFTWLVLMAACVGGRPPGTPDAGCDGGGCLEEADAGAGGGSGGGMAGCSPSSELIWSPSPLDLGFAQPGTEVLMNLTFATGNTKAQLSNFRPSTGDFRVAVVPASAIEPCTSAAVTIAFKPTLVGPRVARIDFETDLPKQPSGSLVVKGYGGGPLLEVAPTLAVGPVAYFAGATPPSSVRRSLVVKNSGVGISLPNVSTNLKLGALSFSNFGGAATAGEFSVTAPASYDPAVGLAIGESMELSVEFRPSSTGQKSVTLTVDSNAGPGFIAITAEAVVLPPCDYTVAPTSLDFGLLAPGTSRDLPVVFKNNGQNASDTCLLSSVALGPGSHPSLSLPGGPLTSTMLQPGQAITVIVRAAPAGATPSTILNAVGTLELSISNPTKPRGTIPLLVAVGQACRSIAPRVLDFGTVAKDCDSETRTVSLYNVCTTGLTVNSLSLVGAEFAAVNTTAIGPGAVLNPAAPKTFSLEYHPIDLGADTGTLRIRLNQNGTLVDYVLPLSGSADQAGLNIDTFVVATKADVLLVIDGSCSMASKQSSLANNFASLVQYATTAGVDHQLGVITTDIGLGGRLVSATGNPKILTTSTPDLENLFKIKVSVGTGGSAWEQSLAPATAALMQPVISTDNAGFVRPEAALGVIAFSDAEDQSPQTVAFYVAQLLNVKARRGDFTFSAMGPYLSLAPSGCSYDGPGGDARTLEAIVATNGQRGEICTSDWAGELSRIAQVAFGRRTRFFLDGLPDLTAGKTISVKVDANQLPPMTTGGAPVWTYEPTTNSVSFEPLYVPTPGQTVSVGYSVACY